ncbi:hypothetical protein BSPWISOXPB_5581 [uncultured Gammaproteobacteria bacterium]|nr:hypothetical protein BSPWISOXPB_5581 [uncultured Gammaproteobacteria bacterium]
MMAYSFLTKTTMARLMTALSYLAITRFYPMAIKQPMALKPKRLDIIMMAKLITKTQTLTILKFGKTKTLMAN